MCLHVSKFQNGVKLVSFTRRCVYQELTLNVPYISESCIEIKIKWNFYFHTSTWCLKRFYEVFKTFIKPFETPQRNVKIKILLIFFSSSGIGTGRVKKCSFFGKFGMLLFSCNTRFEIRLFARLLTVQDSRRWGMVSISRQRSIKSCTTPGEIVHKLVSICLKQSKMVFDNKMFTCSFCYKCKSH